MCNNSFTPWSKLDDVSDEVLQLIVAASSPFVEDIFAKERVSKRFRTCAERLKKKQVWFKSRAVGYLLEKKTPIFFLKQLPNLRDSRFVILAVENYWNHYSNPWEVLPEMAAINQNLHQVESRNPDQVYGCGGPDHLQYLQHILEVNPDYKMQDSHLVYNSELHGLGRLRKHHPGLNVKLYHNCDELKLFHNYDELKVRREYFDSFHIVVGKFVNELFTRPVYPGVRHLTMHQYIDDYSLMAKFPHLQNVTVYCRTSRNTSVLDAFIPYLNASVEFRRLEIIIDMFQACDIDPLRSLIGGSTRLKEVILWPRQQFCPKINRSLIEVMLDSNLQCFRTRHIFMINGTCLLGNLSLHSFKFYIKQSEICAYKGMTFLHEDCLKFFSSEAFLERLMRKVNLLVVDIQLYERCLENYQKVVAELSKSNRKRFFADLKVAHNVCRKIFPSRAYLN